MKRLLLIEDNHMMAMFLANYFTNSFSISIAKSPSEALELIEEGHVNFDLALVDYKSEEHKEYNHLKSLSEKLKWLQTPVIMLTDEDKSEQRLNAFQLGVKDTLSKPFNPEELNLRAKTIMATTVPSGSLRQVA